ncbi:hypothetical protein [Halobacillus karajensis]|uniref:hypothetical protein n=1 Tax=Halobacillus karajensis TaxID=195088 RepID=UPI00094458D9|nr:hypothetical protein [Halobacillus karajensis]
MVAGNALLLFIMRGPNADLRLFLPIGTLFIAGIVSAFLSKIVTGIILGTVLNGGVLGFMYFLVLAIGIGEP